MTSFVRGFLTILGAFWPPQGPPKSGQKCKKGVKKRLRKHVGVQTPLLIGFRQFLVDFQQFWVDFWCHFGTKKSSSSKRVPPELRHYVSPIHTLYTIRYTLYAIRHTRYAIKSTLNALRYRLYATRFILHTISYTLHTIRCTPYILYALYAECGLKRFLSE